ncbi:argonaute protein [Spatholobus suberectus]|nr:argonaute protein [Spatholobus suberectus]
MGVMSKCTFPASDFGGHVSVLHHHSYLKHWADNVSSPCANASLISIMTGLASFCVVSYKSYEKHVACIVSFKSEDKYAGKPNHHKVTEDGLGIGATLLAAFGCGHAHSGVRKALDARWPSRVFPQGCGHCSHRCEFIFPLKTTHQNLTNVLLTINFKASKVEMIDALYKPLDNGSDDGIIRLE